MSLHRHRWRIVGVEHIRLIGDFSEKDITLVKRVCEVCGKPGTKKIDGTWKVEELQPA